MPQNQSKSLILPRTSLLNFQALNKIPICTNSKLPILLRIESFSVERCSPLRSSVCFQTKLQEYQQDCLPTHCSQISALVVYMLGTDGLDNSDVYWAE